VAACASLAGSGVLLAGCGSHAKALSEREVIEGFGKHGIRLSELTRHSGADNPLRVTLAPSQSDPRCRPQDLTVNIFTSADALKAFLERSQKRPVRARYVVGHTDVVMSRNLLVGADERSECFRSGSVEAALDELSG